MVVCQRVESFSGCWDLGWILGPVCPFVVWDDGCEFGDRVAEGFEIKGDAFPLDLSFFSLFDRPQLMAVDERFDWILGDDSGLSLWEGCKRKRSEIRDERSDD